ncbi:hypothetical protein MANES_S041516v8 [Manihot esculenta]|uniref:Uncharacterized protein n=1 Tax=Manihot esculenta TaxID=3983 RepID=A0ACB7FX40_MANES|nr:hypothetical protein MANES_S041516v8 [Manihot esculenta]
MSGSSGMETTTSSQPSREGRGRREKSRDILAALEERLARVEAAMSEHREKCEDMDLRISELESKGDVDELRDEMQGALNVAVDLVSKRGDKLEETLRRLREKVDQLDVELGLCKTAVVSGRGASTSGVAANIRYDAPKPKPYSGERSAREIDNFLWTVERYFEAVGILDDEGKIRNVPLYLSDIAMVWWRRRCEDVRRGTCTISTWADFVRELKRQFYPENAESEARAKLRRLQHKEGHIREYVKEFSELLLEIPDMGEKDALFCFLDGLTSWAKLELQRRGVQDLASAIAAAESLIEFQRKNFKGDGERDSPRHHKDSRHVDGEHAKGDEAKREKPRVDKGKEKMGDSPRPPIKCFICEGPHRAFNCPKRNALAALINKMEDEEKEQGGVASMGLLPPKKGDLPKGRVYVEAKVLGKKIKAMVDTGAEKVYMDKGLAEEIGLSYSKHKGYVKGFDQHKVSIAGVARGVDLCIGDFRGKTDIVIVPLEEKLMYLGIDFLKEKGAFLMLHANTMGFMVEGQPLYVPIHREDWVERRISEANFSSNIGAMTLVEGQQGSKGLEQRGRCRNGWGRMSRTEGDTPTNSPKLCGRRPMGVAKRPKEPNCPRINGAGQSMGKNSRRAAGLANSANGAILPAVGVGGSGLAHRQLARRGRPTGANWACGVCRSCGACWSCRTHRGCGALWQRARGTPTGAGRCGERNGGATRRTRRHSCGARRAGAQGRRVLGAQAGARKDRAVAGWPTEQIGPQRWLACGARQSEVRICQRREGSGTCWKAREGSRIIGGAREGARRVWLANENSRGVWLAYENPRRHQNGPVAPRTGWNSPEASRNLQGQQISHQQQGVHELVGQQNPEASQGCEITI